MTNDSGIDEKAKQNSIALGCSIMGKNLAYQIYNRNKPYPIVNHDLSAKNFEKFENEYKFKNTYSLLIILILFIVLIYYFYV